MGLLDYADLAREKLKGLLGGMPIVQIAQGRAEMPTMGGLLGALRGMPIGPDPQGAYDAAMAMGPLVAGMTKWEKAHKVAQKNATKMLGLPKDNTAADRAKALGFSDEVLYHGTVNDFPAFATSNRSSVYASDSPPIAGIYADATGRHRGLREVNAGPNILPIVARGKAIEVSDLGPSGHGWWTDNLASALGIDTSIRPMAKRAKDFGIDRIKVTNMSDLGGEQTQHIFPDPSVIRSRFAAFDPARVNENDLLAAYFGFPMYQGNE